MDPQLPVVPRYKLLLRYDIRADVQTSYYQYVMREFVPALHEMGLYAAGVWHTAWGPYPMRQLDFVTDDLAALHRTLADDRWARLEKRLKQYTTTYTRKLVAYQPRFQF